MKPILPQNLEATLLFDSFGHLEPKQLNSLLNQIVAEHDLSFKWIPSDEGPKVFQYICDECGVRVLQSDSVHEFAEFENTLKSDYTNKTFPLAADAVRNHRSHVKISVGRGVIDKTGEEHVGGLSGTNQTLDGEEFEFVVNLLKSLTMIFMSASRPMAIYWKQSDKLMTLRQFAEVGIEPRDISLLVHPRISAVNAGQEESDATLSMLSTTGAVNLIGYEIEFEPSSIAPDRLIERAMQFLLKVRETGALIPDGDTFGIDADETIRVHHPRNGMGEPLRLVFEKETPAAVSPMSTPPSLPEEAYDDLDEVEVVDPEDPTERALQDRIDAMKNQLAAERNFDEGDGEAEGEEPKPVHEPWQGVKKRPDISALRALTRIEQTQTHDQDEAGEAHRMVELQDDAPEASTQFETPNLAPELDEVCDDDVVKKAVETEQADTRVGLMSRVTGMLKR